MDSFESVRCRLCGHQLKSSSGCSECGPVKSSLVWPAVTGTDSDVSAEAVISTTLKALKRRLTKLGTEIKSEGQSYDHRLTRDLATISRTLKELATEKRKLEDRDEAKYARLGIEGRMNLMVSEFFAALPEDFQIQLLQKMRDVFEKQNKSLLPE